MQLLRAYPPVPVRVALVEDHPRLRTLIRSQLDAAAGIVVVGEAESGVEAVALVQRVQPDVLVLDIELVGGLDGLGVAMAVADGGCRILAHSSHSDPVHVSALLRAGASGYLSKEAPLGEIVAAVRAVAEGEGRWFEASPPPTESLSEGARAALRHLALGGMPHTISPPRGLADLLSELSASSWYEALARAWALGLVRDGRERATWDGYESGLSMRSKDPGQASSARARSYGA